MNKIKNRRIELGLSQLELAKQLGVTQNTISVMERSDEVSEKYYAPLEKALKCRIGELIDNVAALPSTTIPIVCKVPAGGMMTVFVENENDYLGEINFDFKPSVKAMLVEGESMNLEIPEGYNVLWEPADGVSAKDLHGRIVVVQSTDGITLKKMDYQAGTLRPVSSSPKHQEPLFLKDFHSVRVVGVVVGAIKLWK